MFGPEMMEAGFLAGILALVGAFLMVFVALAIGMYIYTAFALMTIAKKLKRDDGWLAWIPFANLSLILMMGSFHWAFVFLILIPLLGWLAVLVLLMISLWRIYEKRRYPGWLALIPIAGFIPFLGLLASVANLVILGLVAWSDRK